MAKRRSSQAGSGTWQPLRGLGWCYEGCQHGRGRLVTVCCAYHQTPVLAGWVHCGWVADGAHLTARPSTRCGEMLAGAPALKAEKGKRMEGERKEKTEKAKENKDCKSKKSQKRNTKHAITHPTPTTTVTQGARSPAVRAQLRWTTIDWVEGALLAASPLQSNNRRRCATTV